ncbi:PD-(D/E)XK motif protein [Pseudomonas aeruginosa]
MGAEWLELAGVRECGRSSLRDRRGHRLVLCLTDHQLKDLFSIMCADLADASSRSESPAGAANIFAVRLNRWADLLRRGRSREMSFRERLGLLGELCLVKWLIDVCEVAPEVVTRGWRGPDGDTNDIGLNNVRIEVKSQLSTQPFMIRVSSLEQLDGDGRELCVALHRFTVSESGVSLASLVADISFRLSGTHSGLMEFQRKLFLVGYQHDAGYVSEAFNLDAVRVYRVAEGFPRLVPSTVPDGIVRVKYDIACEAIDDYRIDQMELEMFING